MKAQNASEGVSVNGPQTPRSSWASPAKRASRATGMRPGARRRSCEKGIAPPSDLRQIIPQPSRAKRPHREPLAKAFPLLRVGLAEEEGFEPPVPFGTAVFKWVRRVASRLRYPTDSTGRAV